MAAKIEVRNKSIIIRPVNSPIIQEDLVTFSNLIIRPQVRSTILQTNNTLQSSSFSSTKVVNFLKPRQDQRFFTSDWTDDNGKEENFGIDSIDLTFDANYIPRVNINFKDVRGKALFDNLDMQNSPFVNFLSLPYPLFELELKGYYGKATSILLSLLKFNTKFNSTNGNFESVGNFVGLNFGFLSDIPVYFGLSAPYMVIDGNINGTKILQEIYDEQFANSPQDKSQFLNQKGGGNYYTFLDLVRISKNLNVLLTQTIKTDVKDQIKQIVQTITDLTQTNKEISLANNTEQIATIIEERKLESLDEDRIKLETALSGIVLNLDNRDRINVALSSLISDYEKQRDLIKDDLFEQINNVIIESIGLNFTIENVFRIIINSFEVFFRMLNKISDESAKNIKNRSNRNIVQNTATQTFESFLNFEKKFPWPKWVNATQNGPELAFPDPLLYPFEKKFVDAFIEASINTINLIQQESVDFSNTPVSFDWNPTTQQTFTYQNPADISEFTSEKIAKIIYGSLFGLMQTFDNAISDNGINNGDFSRIANLAGKLDMDNIYKKLTSQKQLTRFKGQAFNDMVEFNALYSGFTSSFSSEFNSIDKEIFYIKKDTIRDYIISDVESFNNYKQIFNEKVFNIANQKDVYTYSFDGEIKDFINILLNTDPEVKYASDYDIKIKHLHFYINLYYNPNTTQSNKNEALEKIKITFYSLFFTESAKEFINNNPKIGGFVNINRRDAALIYANAAFYDIQNRDNIGNHIILNTDNIPYSTKETILFSGDTFNTTLNAFIGGLEDNVRRIITTYIGEINSAVDLREFEVQQNIVKNNLAKIEKVANNYDYIFSSLLVGSDSREDFYNRITRVENFNNFIYKALTNSIRLKQIPPPENTSNLVAIPPSLSSRPASYFEYKNSFNLINGVDPVDLLLLNLENINPKNRERLKELLNIVLTPVSRPSRSTNSNNFYREYLVPLSFDIDSPKISLETDIYYTAKTQNQQDYLQNTTYNNYFAGFRQRREELIQTEPIQNKTELDSLRIIVDSDDIKLSLYLMFKNIHDKWFYVKENNEFVFRLRPSGFNGKVQNTLFDLFSFVDRGNREIGNEAVIDITFFNNYLSSGSSIKNSLYNLISELLAGSSSGNQWNFYVLPSYFNFGGANMNTATTLEETYQTMFGQYTTVEKELSSAPKFLCQYIGGVSSQLDIDSENFSDDAATEKFLEESETEITVFEIDFGNEQQGIFKSIQLDQAEFRETSEGLAVIDKLAQTDGSSNIQAQSGNLYNVYSNRSYTAKIEMAGNMMILPTMYFRLKNIPMYKGYYLITKVNHTIVQGSFSTSIEGVRIPLYRLPIVKELITFVKRQLLDTILETTPTNDNGSISGATLATPVFIDTKQPSKYGIVRQGGIDYDAKQFIAALIIAEGSGVNDANNKAILASLYNRAKEEFSGTPTNDQVLSRIAKQIIKSGQYEPWSSSGKNVANLIKTHLKGDVIPNSILTLLNKLEQGYDRNIFQVENFPNYTIQINPIPNNGEDSNWNINPKNFSKQSFNVADTYYFIGLDSQRDAGRGLTDTFFNAFKVGNFSTENNPRVIAAIRTKQTSGLLQVYFRKN